MPAEAYRRDRLEKHYVNVLARAITAIRIIIPDIAGDSFDSAGGSDGGGGGVIDNAV